jgi:hypothetical protein
MNKKVSKALRKLATIEGVLKKDILKELKREWNRMTEYEKSKWKNKNGKTD